MQVRTASPQNDALTPDRAFRAPTSSPEPPRKAEAPAQRRRFILRAPRSPLARAGLAVAAIAAVAAIVILARPPSVETQTIGVGPAIDVVYATGVVEYVREARLTALVAAPITRVAAAEGQRVREGEVLAQLQDDAPRAAAAQAEAQAGLSRVTADRTYRLYKANYESRAAWDQARAQRDADAAAARAARARLADYAVRAPFAGIILRRDADPGNLASPSAVLFVMADDKRLRVTADLDERDVALVAQGQRALIRADAFGQRAFDARVSEITPQGDSTARTFRVRLALPNDTPLKGGMTVDANIITGARDGAVLAPKAALSDQTAWVVENGRAHKRTVVRGATGASTVEILSGLHAGEAVILNPSSGLHEGARVRARSAPR